jgi:hypothetical protein
MPVEDAIVLKAAGEDPDALQSVKKLEFSIAGNNLMSHALPTR